MKKTKQPKVVIKADAIVSARKGTFEIVTFAFKPTLDTIAAVKASQNIEVDLEIHDKSGVLLPEKPMRIVSYIYNDAIDTLQIVTLDQTVFG